MLEKKGQAYKKVVQDEEGFVRVKKHQIVMQKNNANQRQGVRSVQFEYRPKQLHLCVIVESHVKENKIMIGWNHEVVTVMVIKSTKQDIFSLLDSVKSKFGFCCTFVYAANTGRETQQLWRDLNVQ
ncbi:hypothetical protein Tco_0540020, partial [Tanacetum coccineum]